MPNRPNILIFMTDHQRADTVLPDSLTISPNIKRLAAEGVRFDRAYCPMAHCCPSRASFFTGLYPSRHGVWNNICNESALSSGLSDGVRTFGEDLKESGYNLAFSGKWHVSITEGPGDRGWDERYISSASERIHGSSWENIISGAAREPTAHRPPGVILRPGYNDEVLYRRDDRGSEHDETTVREAVKAIRELSQKDAPWAVYVGLIMPHAPYNVPQKYLDMYNIDDVTLPESYYDDLRDKPNYYRKLRNMRFDQLPELEVRDAIRHFRAMCTYIDDLFGRVMAALDETGQADDTLVLMCSDHGDYLGDHGLFHKGVPSFESAYRVPAIVRWPNGVVNPGRTVDTFVSLADFAPTFTELGGKAPDAGLTGRSLVPFLRGEQPENWRDCMYTQCNGVENYFTQRMIFNEKYKYVYNGFDFDEFYDLEKDPDEVINRIDAPGYDEIKRELLKKMWQFAYQEKDGLGTYGGYITVGTALYGPGVAFEK